MNSKTSNLYMLTLKSGIYPMYVQETLLHHYSIILGISQKTYLLIIDTFSNQRSVDIISLLSIYISNTWESHSLNSTPAIEDINTEN